MNYVIYELESTRFVRIFRRRHWQDAEYATMAAARAGWTAINKKLAEQKQPLLSTATHGIAEKAFFHAKIEKTRKTRNILNPSAGEFDIPVNTPACCDPGTETYHCM